MKMIIIIKNIGGIHTSKKEDLVQLFKDWTKASALLSEGKAVGDLSSNEFLPPKDTGEAAGLSASNLTITFGVGPSCSTINPVSGTGINILINKWSKRSLEEVFFHLH
jgi:hypothetical protein